MTAHSRPPHTLTVGAPIVVVTFGRRGRLVPVSVSDAPAASCDALAVAIEGVSPCWNEKLHGSFVPSVESDAGSR